MFTLVGFYDDDAHDGLTPLLGLDDEHITVHDYDITVPALNNVVGVFVMGDAIKQARLDSPSLRRLWNEDLTPILTASRLPTVTTVDEGGSSTHELHFGVPLVDRRTNPLVLTPSEKMNLLVDNGNTAENDVALVWLSDGPIAPVAGDIHTIRATVSKTLSAWQWTNARLDFDQNLPAGRYQVVGAKFVGDNLVAGRLVFVGGTWRPGGLGVKDESDPLPAMFRFGGMGVWGEFEFDQPPTVDLLASAGDTSAVVYLDLIQVRAGR